MNTVHISLPQEESPVDAVITWVDGDDPLHQKKLNQYLKHIGVKPRSASRARFDSSGEVDYCIKSLLKFAPFLRKIFIVTDSQTPPIFKALDELSSSDRRKLILVDHQDIFPENIDCLPTFNSLSIETVLHRIPGLSEHFVYFNDDLFLVNPIKREDWFDGDFPVMRGFWRTQEKYPQLIFLKKWLYRNMPAIFKRSEVGFNALQIAAARLAGFETRYFSVHHTPTAMRKSTIEAFYIENPELMIRNLSFPLRDPAQFLPHSLACHLELKKGTVRIRRGHRLLYLKPNVTSLFWTKLKLYFLGWPGSPIKFACIQNLESTRKNTQSYIFSWLRKRTS